MYCNCNMKIYGIREVQFLLEFEKTLIGYFWCYPDNTEEVIEVNPSLHEIEDKYNSGIYIGEEFAFSMAPMLFCDDIVVLSNNETGIVSYYARDAQQLAIFTTNDKVYPISLFDDDLYYTGTNSEIFVKKIGKIPKHIDKTIMWTWKKYNCKDNITTGDLKILLTKRSMLVSQ